MQSAQSWALTQLAQKYSDKYKSFYKKNREFNPMLHRARSQWLAKQKLMHEYSAEYKDFYAQGREQGFPRRAGTTRRRVGG